MTQQEWDGLKKLHNIESDAALHDFLLQYMPVFHFTTSLHGIELIQDALAEYEPEPWESGLRKQLIDDLQILKIQTQKGVKIY